MFLGGCAANKVMCPAQDTIDIVWSPYGSMIIQTDKGAYSEDRHSLEKFKKGDGWITLEEYKVWIKKLQEKRTKEGSI